MFAPLKTTPDYPSEQVAVGTGGDPDIETPHGLQTTQFLPPRQDLRKLRIIPDDDIQADTDGDPDLRED